MDSIVKAAMAKWPNVPACRGWLGLDARGQWFMRDDRVQAAGVFANRPGEELPVSKGSVLKHDKLVDFIHRNYTSDDSGRWFFQNGPQRVYVELELAPWVWRLQPDGGVVSHTGLPAQVQAAVLDDEGRLYLETDQGFGIVHTADMVQALTPVEEGIWTPVPVATPDIPRRFGFVLSPQRAFSDSE